MSTTCNLSHFTLDTSSILKFTDFYGYIITVVSALNPQLSIDHVSGVMVGSTTVIYGSGREILIIGPG